MLKDDPFFENEAYADGEDIVEYDIIASPRDLTPANIVDMIDSGIIEIPLFQRNFVWDMKKASKLVESLILGLPVPELFFYSEGDENTTYKIIDGQQRLLSIYFFIKGRFPRNSDSRIVVRNTLNCSSDLGSLLADNNIFKDFVLQLDEADSRVKSRYQGNKFMTLDKDSQIKFRLRRYLRTVVVRQNKPNDDSSSMFEIFNRLNTGGTPLNHQEIRASLYYCDFYAMLVETNDKECWRKLLGKPTQDLRSGDVELILRSLALLQDGDNYSPKMVTFLNDFSRKSKAFNREHIEYMQNLFISFIDSCSELGDKAFFRNNRFSKTLFESTFVAVSKKSFVNNSLVTGKIESPSFESLKNNKEFISYLMSGSSSTDNILNRLALATNSIVMKEGDLQ
ncbi:MAG: DUF262 domain-containing protein [Oscillospiraceae bacterium]